MEGNYLRLMPGLNLEDKMIYIKLLNREINLMSELTNRPKKTECINNTSSKSINSNNNNNNNNNNNSNNINNLLTVWVSSFGVKCSFICLYCPNSCKYAF